MNEVSQPVTLDNCAREPIHIPGQIQSHGAMLVFDLQGVATYVSANARALLGPTVPALGEMLAPHHFEGDATIHDTVASLLLSAGNGHRDELTDGSPFNADV